MDPCSSVTVRSFQSNSAKLPLTETEVKNRRDSSTTSVHDRSSEVWKVLLLHINKDKTVWRASRENLLPSSVSYLCLDLWAGKREREKENTKKLQKVNHNTMRNFPLRWSQGHFTIVCCIEYRERTTSSVDLQWDPVQGNVQKISSAGSVTERSVWHGPQQIQNMLF